MRRLLTFFLLSTFLMGCQPASTSPEPDSISHIYTYSDASLLNPERGFFTPANENQYQLALCLPDGSQFLRENPLYAIQFANKSIFDEATGLNILGTVNINNNVSGSYLRGKDFGVIK